MENKLNKSEGEKFVERLKNGEIEVFRSKNHDYEFSGGGEKKYKKNFCSYLGSCGRYLSNKRLKEQKYYG